MTKLLTFKSVLANLLTLSASVAFSQPANDACSGTVPSINPSTTCTTTSGTLYKATATNPTGSCGSGYDAWYQFTLASASFIKINVALTGSSLTTTTTYVELFNASSCSLSNTSLGCYNVSSPYLSGLLTTGTYYFRVYTTGNPSTGATGNWAFNVCVTLSDNVDGEGSRMREVFKQRVISPPNVLNDPWEIAYGPDNYLWITEAKGYKVYRMDPNTGSKTTVLDISPTGSGYLTAAQHTAFNREDWSAQTSAWPQGGLAGLALHPKFMAVSNPKNYVYVSYTHDYDRTDAGKAGIFFVNWIVRFTYNTSTGRLESPLRLIDTIPGSSDHNSQRMIIAPVNGNDYLFYAAGDMGAGQFENGQRPNKAQITASYEGKILRFNLEPDASEGTYDQWIPNDNPFNTTSPAKQSAVWATGIRNNQGFAFAKINGVDYLYGSSHGPFSDDEINIVEKAKNYGHPRVIGYSTDGNYNDAKAGEPGSALPLIYNEYLYARDTIGTLTYRDPIFTFYPAVKGDNATPSSIQFIYNNQTYPAGWASGTGLNANGNWYSEAISGMEIYTKSVIPGWKNSLLLGTLKGGKMERMKLTDDGTDVNPAGSAAEKMDTLGYFRSKNRYRDVAIAPDGKTFFTIIDKSQTTSGPTQSNPMISACPGCVQQYTFLGYDVNSSSGNRSTIRTLIPVASGKTNIFETANKVVINAANGNNDVWVPITDTSSNVIAEIWAQGHDLDTVTTTLFTRTGTSRIASGKKYVNRNMTITPQNQPGGTVSIRLYISKAEYDAFVADGGTTISSLKIIKNQDSAKTAISSSTTQVTTTVAEAFGTGGYVLQGDISSFSSFYFAGSFIALPTTLLIFNGSLQTNSTLLQWRTETETNVSHFDVERSVDGTNFTKIGAVNATGNSSNPVDYSLVDGAVMSLQHDKIYYRLKTVDANRTSHYSNIVTVMVPDQSLSISVSPNPVTHDASVRIKPSLSGTIQWKLVDNNGRTISQNKIQVTKDVPATFLMKMESLANGSYFLQLSGAGIDRQIQVQKM